MAVMRIMRNTGGSLFGGRPEAVDPGMTEFLSLRSRVIRLIVVWPSDWFPVMVMVKVPGLEYWWVSGRSADFVRFPSFQSTLTDSMVRPGEPGLRFPFSVTFVLSITGSRKVRKG